MTTDTYLTAGLNGILSGAIVFICICRARKITSAVLWRIKGAYAVLLMGAAANGFSPWLWDYPGWPSVFFDLAILAKLLIESRDWRDGPPFTATSPAPLSASSEV